MPSQFTLPVVAGLSILGGLGGIWLGNSSVGMINPAYFSEPETRFHADAVPYRSPDWAQVQAAENAQMVEGEIITCVGCRNWPEEYRPVRDATIRAFDGGKADGWSAGTMTAGMATSDSTTDVATAEPAAEEPDPEMQRVQAYSSYAVDSRERREAPAEADDEQPPVEEDSGSE